MKEQNNDFVDHISQVLTIEQGTCNDLAIVLLLIIFIEFFAFQLRIIAAKQIDRNTIYLLEMNETFLC